MGSLPPALGAVPAGEAEAIARILLTGPERKIKPPLSPARDSRWSKQGASVSPLSAAVIQCGPSRDVPPEQWSRRVVAVGSGPRHRGGSVAGPTKPEAAGLRSSRSTWKSSLAAARSPGRQPIGYRWRLPRKTAHIGPYPRPGTSLLRDREAHRRRWVRLDGAWNRAALSDPTANYARGRSLSAMPPPPG